MARKTAVIGPDKIKDNHGVLVLDVPHTVYSDSWKYNREQAIDSGAYIIVPEPFKAQVLKAREVGRSLQVTYDIGAPDELLSVQDV